MTKLITIARGAVNAKIVTEDKRVHALVQDLLSYSDDGASYASAGSSWTGRSSFFEYDTGIFPAGFVVRVFQALTSRGFQVNVVRKPLPEPLGEENPKVDEFPEDPRYDYQAEVPKLVLKYGQVIAQVATGGGKSRIAKLCVMRIKRPTLFLTTRGILMYQMRDAFERDLGMSVGVYGDGENTGAPKLMNVGMVQSFMAWLAFPDSGDPAIKQEAQRRRQREALDILSKFEFVILEEAHEASSDSYFTVMKCCVNAHYRLALTATPFMKDSEKANMQLEAASGPVAIKVSEKMLIDRGILARPFFKYANIPDPYPACDYVGTVEYVDRDGRKRKREEEMEAKLHRGTTYPRSYELGIVGNRSRNAEIVREVKRATEHGLTSMVLVQHKAHGVRLHKLLTASGVRSAWIEGKDSQDVRQAAISALKSGDITCLIGSTILDVGVDVPAVGLVVLAGGGKAEVAVRQRIGRGLREKRSGPNVCFILDFVDPVNNTLRDHARERRLIVDVTPGFAEGVVSDFPYQTYFPQRAIA